MNHETPQVGFGDHSDCSDTYSVSKEVHSTQWITNPMGKINEEKELNNTDEAHPPSTTSAYVSKNGCTETPEKGLPSAATLLYDHSIDPRL
jgi:hypothetical protein